MIRERETPAVERLRRAWGPLAEALRDRHAGRRDARVVIRDDLGNVDAVAADRFYAPPEDPASLEARALDLCRGPVLELGAGSGRHALALQGRGLEVCAVEVLPELVDLMVRRGVRDARAGDALHPPVERRFATVLLLMNGVGIFGSLTGLDRFLAGAAGLLSPGGALVCDSADLGAGTDGGGRQEGAEVQFQIEYRGRRGEPFPQLFVDPDTLASVAGRRRWDTEIVAREKRGAFVARLRPRDGGWR